MTTYGSLFAGYGGLRNVIPYPRNQLSPAPFDRPEDMAGPLKEDQHASFYADDLGALMGGVGSGSKPRDYELELVERVRQLYESGLTIREVQALVPGCKVQNLMDRCGISRRAAVKRDQSGARNHSWKGDQAGYQALHLRVETARGKPKFCEHCSATAGRFEWANLTENYADVNDYIRLCVSCHRQMDADRRKALGRRTSPHRR